MRHATPLLIGLLAVLCLCGCQPPPAASSAASSDPATRSQPATATAETSPLPVEPGFEQIRFDQMAVFPLDNTTAQTWSEHGEEFVCTGKPKCYLYTKSPRGDGTLRFDYRFEPDPPLTDPAKLASQNTGVLLFIQEPHAIWPQSIEVQGKHSEMGQLRPNGGAAAVVFTDSPAVRESARRPVGEWNSIEIMTKAGAITASINGQVVSVGQSGELKNGLVGLQAEGHRLRYRHLRFCPAP